MAGKKSLEDVLKGFAAKHGDTYDYSKVAYAGTDTKVIIICKKHGEFLQSPYCHAKGQRCPGCGGEERSRTKFLRLSKSIVEDFRKVHGDLYEYDLVKYVTATDPVKIVCKEHGVFLQTPNKHKNGRGCPACAGVRWEESQARGGDFLSFRERMLSIGKSEEEIDNCGFVRMQSNISLNCEVHGSYFSIASEVIKGRGCPKCGDIEGGKKRIKTAAKTFKSKANRVHKNKYSYENSKYKAAKKMITITCPDHGDFTQVACSHLSGCGCPKCFSTVSRGEISLVEFIKDLGFEVKTSDRSVLSGREIDILVGDSFGIEYNGLFWHSERSELSDGRPIGWAKGHMIGKLKDCQSRGVGLLHVMESDNPTVIRKLIVSRLGADPERYGARQCSVGISDSKDQDVRDFYSRNHIQGNVLGCKVYTLRINGQIVAAMSFSRSNSERGNRNPFRYELRRYATCCKVPGGASRLLKAFIRNTPECETLISYSDNRLFSGGMYEKIGFRLVSESGPDYKYTKRGKIEPKGRFRRSRLEARSDIDFRPEESELENCTRNKWYRVWDCGKKKWLMDI